MANSAPIPIQTEQIEGSFATFLKEMLTIFTDTPAYISKSVILCVRFLIFGFILLLCILVIDIIRNVFRRKYTRIIKQGAVCVVLTCVLLLIYAPRTLKLPVQANSSGGVSCYLGKTMVLGQNNRDNIAKVLSTQHASLRIKSKPKYKDDTKVLKVVLNYDYIDVNVEIDGKNVYYYTNPEKALLYKINDENEELKKMVATVMPQ